MSHTPSVTIRRLGADDLGLFRNLLAVFGNSFDDPVAYASRPPRKPYLERLLSGGDFIALAALHDSTVVGGLVAYVLKKFEQERSEIYIYDLAVTADYRRRGIATALIAKLKTIAKRQGAYVIFVQADLTDEPAIALYSKLGTREDVLHFDIAVPSGRTVRPRVRARRNHRGRRRQV